VTKDMICVACPLGCELTALVGEAGGLAGVTGNQCRRGVAYAEAEIENPTRAFHSTLRVAGGTAPLVSVKSDRPVPKGLLLACAGATKHFAVKAPIQIGDVLVRDVCGTGADLIATCRVAAA